MDQITELSKYSDSLGIKFMVSVWDKDSVDLMVRLYLMIFRYEKNFDCMLTK